MDKVEQNTTIVGKLTQRQYKAGQPYAQLVFKTKKGTKLSLSRNLRMLKSLSVGKTYRVTGAEYELGTKVYIHEPIVTKLSAFERFSYNKKPAVISALACLTLIGVFATGNHLYSNNLEKVSAQQTTAVKVVSKDTGAEEVKSESTNPTPAATTPATTPTKTATTSKKTSTSSQPSTPTPTPTTPAAPITTPTPEPETPLPPAPEEPVDPEEPPVDPEPVVDPPVTP